MPGVDRLHNKVVLPKVLCPTCSKDLTNLSPPRWHECVYKTPDQLQAEIADLRRRLELWRDGDVAWDCIATVAADYYTDAQGKLRCGICHIKKGSQAHKDCFTLRAANLLQRLKEEGEGE